MRVVGVVYQIQIGVLEKEFKALRNKGGQRVCREVIRELKEGTQNQGWQLPLGCRLTGPLLDWDNSTEFQQA